MKKGGGAFRDRGYVPFALKARPKVDGREGEHGALSGSYAPRAVVGRRVCAARMATLPWLARA